MTHTHPQLDIPSHVVSLYRCHCLALWPRSAPDPLFLHSLFLLGLTLTVIIMRIGVTASEGVSLTGNPYFLRSHHLITVEKTDDFSIPISHCPTYSACSEVNQGPVLKSSSLLFISKLAQWEKIQIFHCNWKMKTVKILSLRRNFGTIMVCKQNTELQQRALQSKASLLNMFRRCRHWWRVKPNIDQTTTV